MMVTKRIVPIGKMDVVKRFCLFKFGKLPPGAMDQKVLIMIITFENLHCVEFIFNDSNSDNRNCTTVVGPQDSKGHQNWPYSSQFLCDKNVGVDDEFLRWT